ncbi:hypothetical protein [Nocardia asteroides]
MNLRSALKPLAIVAAIAAVCAIVLVVLGRDDDPADHGHLGGDGHAHVEGPTPSGADAASATKYALTAMFSWRPVEDVSTGQGLARAKPWLAEPLLGQADAPPATGLRPIPQWAGWRTSADVVTATVVIDEVGAVEGGDRRVLATVTQTVLHADGSSTPYSVMHVAAAVVQTPDGWRLSNYRVTG